MYKQATKIERLKFTRWKNVKHNKKFVRTKFYRRVLLDEIASKHRAVKSTRRELNNGKKILFSSTTFFKGIALRFSINQSVEKEELKIVNRHKHKLDNLLQEKNSEDGLTENPNNIITNLSSHTLTEEEFEALRYGLKFGLPTLPCESNILAYTEDIWEQILKSEICNVGKYNEARIKNSLRCLAFNIINIDEKRIFKDQKKIKL